MKVADFFAGAGGFSTGAQQAGLDVVWAGNHWKSAVDIHALNHPNTIHACQDLMQVNMETLPYFDIASLSPCCQGHSPARGKANGNPQHDASRSTARVVIDVAEARQPEALLVENVPEFLDWALYPAWVHAFELLGYTVSPQIVDCADYGVPQHRKRLLIPITKSKAPLMLNMEKEEHIPASSFIDFNKGNWSLVDKPGRAESTLKRVANGRKAFGERFLMPYYSDGSGLTGRSLQRPIGTITTKARWALVDGPRMRMLRKEETRDAMTFPETYIMPDSTELATHLMGNAVPPKLAKKALTALRAQL